MKPSLIPAEALQEVRRLADRSLSPEEFAAIADAPMGEQEYEELRSLILWFRQRYPTAGERLAHARVASQSILRPALIEPTAILSEAWVGPSGVRMAAGQGVRVCLMNVLRWTPTDFDSRAQLLEKVIQSLAPMAPTVLLTPAGYFGHDSPRGRGRLPLREDALDRGLVLTYLQDGLRLPEGLLLAIGLDWTEQQRLLFLQRGGPSLEIVRGHSLASARRYTFAGLTWSGMICFEFQPNEKYGPMYRKEPRYFLAERDIKGRGIDVVLNAAHIEVKGTVNEDARPVRFPFERLFQSVSACGAACFLAHHHPDERWPKTGEPKSHSYSTWGIFAGTGADRDWLHWGRDAGRWADHDAMIRRVSVR